MQEYTKTKIERHGSKEGMHFYFYVPYTDCTERAIFGAICDAVSLIEFEMNEQKNTRVKAAIASLIDSACLLDRVIGRKEERAMGGDSNV